MADEPRPSVLPRWATTGDAASPSGGKLNVGWVAGEAPPHDWFNFIIKNPSDWVRHLDKIANHVAGAIAGTGQTLDTSLANGDEGQLLEAMRVVGEENAIRSGRPVVAELQAINRGIARGGTDDELVIGGVDGNPATPFMQRSDNAHAFEEFTDVEIDGQMAVVAATSGTILLVGQLGAAITVDGSATDAWELVSPSGGGAGKDFLDAIVVETRYLIVGRDGRAFRAPYPVTGGGDWQVCTTGEGLGVDLKRAAYDGSGVLVCAGWETTADIVILRSVNEGLNWSPVTSDGVAGGTAKGRGVAFGNGVWVVAAEGRIQSSDDGAVTFTTRSTGPSEPVNCAVWTGRLFVVPTNTGAECWVSPDGINWVDIGPICTGATEIERVIIDRDRLIFTGELVDPQDTTLAGVWVTTPFI